MSGMGQVLPFWSGSPHRRFQTSNELYHYICYITNHPQLSGLKHQCYLARNPEGQHFRLGTGGMVLPQAWAGFIYANVGNSQSAGWLHFWGPTLCQGEWGDWAICLLPPRRLPQASHSSSSPQEQQDDEAEYTGVFASLCIHFAIVPLAKASFIAWPRHKKLRTLYSLMGGATKWYCKGVDMGSVRICNHFCNLPQQICLIYLWGASVRCVGTTKVVGSPHDG